MALIRIPAENTVLTDAAAVTAFLATHGIDYEQWAPDQPVDADATAERSWRPTRKGRGAQGTRRLSDRRRD